MHETLDERASLPTPTRDFAARVLVLGVFPLLWVVNWVREASGDDPYYDSGRAGFLVMTAFAVAMLAAPYIPAIWAVLARDVPADIRFTAAIAVVGAVTVTVLTFILLAVAADSGTTPIVVLAPAIAVATDVFVLRLTDIGRRVRPRGE